jgi:hypothetical protein
VRRPLSVTQRSPASTPRLSADLAESADAAPAARSGHPAFIARFAADAVAAAFAFAGATAGPRVTTVGAHLPPECRCHRDPEDGSVWVTAAAPTSADPAAAVELAAALGGTIFEFMDGLLVRLAGRHPVPPAGTDTLQPVPLPRLVATLIPTGHPPGSFTEIAVVTTGRIAGAVVRRWQRAAVDVTVTQLLREPLDLPPGQGTQGAMLVRIRSSAGQLHGPAIAALSDLPRTVVCREIERMLIDVRFTLPVDDRQLIAEIPAGESWIIGGGDAGVWRIIERGTEVTPMLDLAVAVPQEDAAAPPGAPASGSRPGGPASGYRTPVRIIAAAQPDGRADAVLVDDAELGRLRRFLARSPLAETAFLVLGPGRHLLTEPAGLLTAVPFGVPVHRIGPGGLYLEAGHVLDPPVPSVARPELFRLDGDSIVVVCTDGSWRLALSAMVPAWSLWVGEVPEPGDGISERGRELLARLTPLAVPAASRAAGTAAQTRPGLDRGRLLDEAERLEQRGKLAEAARRLEESGELFRAALLYERAASESAARRG